jgi:Peptidase family M13
MIHNIRAEFINILDESNWMDDETKIVAKEKVKLRLTIPASVSFSGQHIYVGL